MQAYKYKGYGPDGARREGEIAASSIEEAERKLSAQSLTVVSILPAGMSRGKHSEQTESSFARVSGRRKVKDSEVAEILRNLAVMAEAGVPFVEALDAVVGGASRPSVRAALTAVREEIVGGKPLSAAMRSAPSMFNSLVCDMVRVAEEGGRLDRALSTAANYVERAAEMRKKIMNAMLYPAVLTVIAFLTIGVLIVFVLPKFAGIFETMGADVPVSTRAMLALSEMVRAQPLVALGILAGMAFGLRMAFTSPVVGTALNRLLTRVPVLGDLLIKLSLARALDSIATLLATNVSLMSALEHGAKVSGNAVIHDALNTARTRLEHGGSLSDALAESRAIPASLVQMVAVGERTGRLGALMSATSSHMQEEADSRLKALVSIVEPLMIVVMGGIVGLITLSVVMPIYSVIQNIK